MTEIWRFITGSTEIYVGSIEADVDPVPGSDTVEGRAEILKLSDAVLQRAWDEACG